MKQKVFNRLRAVLSATILGISGLSLSTGCLAEKAQDRTVTGRAPANAPPASCSNGSLFYGIDGHVAQGGPYNTSDDATQIAQVKALGMTVYAQDVWDAVSARRVARLARVAAQACVGVLTVLVPDSKHAADEATAYRDGRNLGVNAATAMHGLVHFYQVGNECDNDAIVYGHGNDPENYDNLKFTKARGSILGMIDGVKTIDPSAKILMCSMSWMHYGFTDMLSMGTQPDGTRGHPIPQSDITAWHWYSDMGDITDAHGVNVLQHLKDTYRKPIWITEYGARPDLSESQAARYLVGTKALAGFVANASAYDIQNVDLYSLYDDSANGGDGDYGLIENNAVTKKERYVTIAHFIATHPMPHARASGEMINEDVWSRSPSDKRSK
jgi:hypothetical protein